MLLRRRDKWVSVLRQLSLVDKARGVVPTEQPETICVFGLDVIDGDLCHRTCSIWMRIESQRFGSPIR